jgi:hypothetical protein
MPLIPKVLFSDTDPDSGGAWDLQYTKFAPGDGPLGTNAVYTSTIDVPESYEAPFYSSWMKGDATPGLEPASKEFTFEALIKLPPKATSPGYADTSMMAAVGEYFGLFSVDVYQYEVFYYGTQLQVSGLTLRYGDIRVDGFDSEYPFGLDGAIVVPELANTAVWHHAAVVQRPGSTDSTRTASFYFDGRLLSEAIDVPVIDQPQWVQPPGYPEPVAFVQGRYGNSNEGFEIVSEPTKIHGIRFTPRALYTGATYTPPTSITSLA